MRALAIRIWLRSSALYRKLSQRDPRNYSPRIREDAIRKYAAGRSFLDVGGMWRVNGRDAFFAESSGATTATILDLLPGTAFEEEAQHRRSAVRFVQGDLHDVHARQEVGMHDVVWCSGILYHVPNPIHTIECLTELAREFLIIQTHTIPEVPGLSHACVYWPHLDHAERMRYAHAYERSAGRAERVGLSTEFDALKEYDNWWWGMSASAVTAMLTTVAGEVVETAGHSMFRKFVVRVRSA